MSTFPGYAGGRTHQIKARDMLSALNILQNVRLSISELVKLYSVSQKKTFVLAFHVSSMHRSYFDKTQISLVTDSLCLPWVRNIA